jgi:hypothetical protein
LGIQHSLKKHEGKDVEIVGERDLRGGGSSRAPAKARLFQIIY